MSNAQKHDQKIDGQQKGGKKIQIRKLEKLETTYVRNCTG